MSRVPPWPPRVLCLRLASLGLARRSGLSRSVFYCLVGMCITTIPSTLPSKKRVSRMTLLPRFQLLRPRHPVARLPLLRWLLAPAVPTFLSSGVFRRTVVVSSLKAPIMTAVWVLLMATCASCSFVPGVQTYRYQAVPSEDSSLTDPRLTREFPGAGRLPEDYLLYSLRQAELLRSWPVGALVNKPFDVQKGCRYSDVIRVIELEEGWVYDHDAKAFYTAFATHSMDAPDAFGRVTAKSDSRTPLSSRSMVQVTFWFRTVSLGVSPTDVDTGITLTNFRASMPEGVQTSWNQTENRSYFEGIQSPVGGVSALGAVPTVQTSMKTVSAGLQYSGIAARLPGGRFRLDATLTVSAFEGAGLDTTNTTVPIQVDGPRGQYVRVLKVYGADASVDGFLRHWKLPAFNTGSTTLQAVELLVRVD